MSFRKIPLTANGQSNFSVDMDLSVFLFVLRFNHSISAWMLDILDVDENVLVAGLVLRPNIDILIPYLQLKEILGGLVMVEQQPGDYQDATKLGTSVVMLWYPPGEEIVLPIEGSEEDSELES